MSDNTANSNTRPRPMQRRILRALWILAIAADAVLLTLLVDPPATPLAAVMVTLLLACTAAALLRPEPIYNRPAWTRKPRTGRAPTAGREPG